MGADEICGFVREEPRNIRALVLEEGLPAWKRNDNGVWRALNTDLMHWLVGQRKKYLKGSKLAAQKELSIANE